MGGLRDIETVDDTTPILVGVGEASERPEDAGYRGLSPVELASAAALEAIADAGGRDLAAHIDVIAVIRQFENASPGAKAPFGRSNNFPRSVAKRIGADPAQAVLEKSGGQGPQAAVNEFCVKLAAGEATMALLVGAEAISTARKLAGAAPTPDWSETVEGTLDDRGFGLKGLITQHHRLHRLMGAPYSYSLLENARRGRLGMTREAYAAEMGALFSDFSKVAAQAPHAAAPKAYEPAELTQVTERNRMIAEPYRRLFVARDQVNQGAAVLITTVGKARELGIAEAKWIYLRGYADVVERTLLDRPDLSSSPAAILAVEAALAQAGLELADVTAFDLYSCFPIPVFNILDGLGLQPDDPRGFTLTGGLPYFGGAGNNYSMHAIAAVARRLRSSPGGVGLVGANGGVMSKYSVGLYSAQAAPFRICDSRQAQAAVERAPAPQLAYEPDGWGRIETYTVAYDKAGAPTHAIIVGRLEHDDRRFLALSPEAAADVLARMVDEDPLGARVFVRSFGFGNRFAFDAETLDQLYPPKPTTFQESYEYCLVARRGHVLEITINRPEARNALHPPAHEELDQIFDAYMADDDLWVAILTAAGTESFCAGNDLKYQSTGRPLYAPKSGFAGLTRRTDRHKPLICAVNGFALGGGLEICLAADLVVADEAAQFALPEARVGLFAGAGGVVRLPRQIPKKVAIEMITTGRPIGAARALELGLINRVAPTGEALAGARLLADQIMECSPNSVRVSLAAMAETASMANEDLAANHRSRLADELIMAEDAAEGVQAFVEKRKPKWKNR